MAQCSKSDYKILPAFIFSTRAVLSSINNDLKCYRYAIGFALHPTDWRSLKLYKIVLLGSIAK